MSIDDPRELIGAYVLDACSPEEEAQVRAHMKVSAEFRAEVESFGDVRRALLDVPAPELAPSPALKRSIMSQVQAEASLFAAAGGGGGRPTPADAAPAVRRGPSPAAPAPVPVAAPPARGAGTPEPAPRRNAFLAALRSPARATALAAVLVALIVGGVVLGTGGGGPTRDVPGQVTALAGPDATVRLVEKGGDSHLKLSGFRAAGSGRKYQVWLKTGNADPRPTKVLFDVDAQGNAEAEIPEDLKTVDDVLVTSEPETGSQAPTTQPVLHVQI